ncbi:MAG: hypothetical protein TU35_009505 [Thermoproteus sp. AZ2]|uniref:Uncharacterized protein n=1 Tax=Thermoproteus sp. AZ2 TaxID=1609232 RepID=A0ACC6V3S6_9CREN
MEIALSPPEYERLYRAARCMLCVGEEERRRLIQLPEGGLTGTARAVVRVSPMRFFGDFAGVILRGLVAAPPYSAADLLAMGSKKVAALICMRLLCSQARRRTQWRVAQLWEDWCLSHAPFKLDEELELEFLALFGRLRRPAPGLLARLAFMDDEELKEFVSRLERDLPFMRWHKIYLRVSPETFFKKFEEVIVKRYVIVPGHTKEQLLSLGPVEVARRICASILFADDRGYYKLWKTWCLQARLTKSGRTESL